MVKSLLLQKKVKVSIYTMVGFLIFLVNVSTTYAVEQFTAETIGGENYDYAKSIIQTTDGGYAIAGYTDGYGAGSNDFYITKLTNAGILDTSFGSNGTRVIGGTSIEYAYSIIQTTDGGYAVAGYTKSYGVNYSDFYIIKLTSTGALDTGFGNNGTRTIGDTGIDRAYSIIQTTDGGYAVAGYTSSYGAGNYDFYITKLTSTGALDTSFGSNGTRTIGGSHHEEAYSIIQTTDGGYIVAGSTRSYGFGVGGYDFYIDFYITKLTSTGLLDGSFGSHGTRVIGGTETEIAYSIIQTTDGGYAIAGETNSYGAGNYDFYIIKLTSTGALDAGFGNNGRRTIGGINNEHAHSIIQTTDGGYAIAGETNSYGVGNSDFYIIKLTNTGALDTSFGSNGTRTIGGAGYDRAYSIIQTTDGGYVIAGETNSYGAGSIDAYIIKLTEAGGMGDCSHNSGGGGTLNSGGMLGPGGGSYGSGGVLGAGGELSSGGTLTQQCTVATTSTLTSSPTTNIQEFQAQGNANITSTGGEDPERLIESGEQQQEHTQKNVQQVQEE